MINGLDYLPAYIPSELEEALLQSVDSQKWLNPLKRRVQHYGYIYDYKRRTITETMRIGHLPDWAQSLAESFHQQGFIVAVPDQVIVNEYLPGQGIAPHVDCEPCFDDTILSLSLGATCVMDFYHLHSDTIEHQILEARSLLVMKAEARYEWKHGIAARKSDKIAGQTTRRGRRVSLTFRKVLLS